MNLSLSLSLSLVFPRDLFAQETIDARRGIIISVDMFPCLFRKHHKLLTIAQWNRTLSKSFLSDHWSYTPVCAYNILFRQDLLTKTRKSNQWGVQFVPQREQDVRWLNSRF